MLSRLSFRDTVPVTQKIQPFKGKQYLASEQQILCANLSVCGSHFTGQNALDGTISSSRRGEFELALTIGRHHRLHSLGRLQFKQLRI